ncbi:MAG: glycoside hydrolase family 32 protein [Prevotella sp.]|nr:glycoside hydrolase family 32 protein [Prevotella sp.]MBQ9223200.1 glycoside hydrolase family 32 protein [Prevotella sp.]
MKKNIFTGWVSCFAAATAILFASCSKDDLGLQYNALIDDPQSEEPTNPDKPVTPPSSGYKEQYRPQIHFTPAQNWINDPNGMVYVDGTYHLFYQYNPQGNSWGNMSWGHATSTDLINWTEQSVAMLRDDLGDVFSGSAVIDKNNTAGFGQNAMVAIYTASGERQQQALAYSTDGGKNFTRYNGNPVIANTSMPDFRDPKVFWHEGTKRWIMALAKGWDYSAEFWGSSDLKNWTKLSEFRIDRIGCNRGQWECPDLIPFGNNWVLIISVNPGGPVLGSGTMYFVGDFDGTTFTADNLDYPLWMDYGMDNYAGVTWSNTGDRKVLIGWMNNWSYAGDVPCSPWRSAMTLPRELKLGSYEGKPLLCSTVVEEIDGIAGEWQVANGNIAAGDAYQLRVTVGLDQNSTITLSNSTGEKYVMEVLASERKLLARRSGQTGNKDFNGSFSIPSMQAPLCVTGNSVTLDIFVDQSSVEIFTKEGTMSMTNLVFPARIYDQVSVEGAASECQMRQLKRIWK